MKGVKLDYRDEYAADRGFLGEEEYDLWVDEALLEEDEERDWDLEVDGYLEREAEEREYH